MICNNLSVNDDGHLTFAGVDTVDMAEKYGTPLYLMDENKIREHIATYKNAMEKYFPKGSVPEFASKAFSTKQIYRIAAEEGIHIDVVSQGEIYTAYKAGFPMERCFFHGNNKTDEDIAFAIDCGVGYFVLDNEDEVFPLNEIARKKGVVQKALLRVTPGIDPHTHKKISTGSVDSKFGSAIETGQAMELTEKILKCENIRLLGFHCHIGSQIFESGPFTTASDMMFSFIADVKNNLGFTTEILNLGGGFGVRYTEKDPEIDYAEKIVEIASVLQNKCDKYGISVPRISMEPGRSIVADAGITLYTVGSVKEIKDCKNYVSIDGGMTDNPRYTLYEAEYTVEIANKMNECKDYTATVAGRCCESGDLIAENVKMAKPKRGDILAVMTTGAYNYSMASNYNRIPRPPVVMLKDGKDYIAVKRETLEDICRLDV
ncbi:MAG: diaminopimelate decarboxylase [Acutalibacteraceae bacterium]|nr:diaminopimelate decarboxylase [Acutalibacteraceae bacterium]